MLAGSARGPIDVFSFGPSWGVPLPTTSPFGIKLVTWLRLYEIPFVFHVENNPAKGPKKKCPYVVLDGKPMGDSQLIIERLKRTAGRDLDAGLGPAERATAHAVRRMLEEHYHQIWEHQLFILEEAWPIGREFFDQLPPGLRVLAGMVGRRALRQQLYQRGIGRHSQDEIVAMGIADLDAVDTLLGDKPFFMGPEPTDIDASVFGFLAVTHYIPSPSAVFTHFRSRSRLGAYCERMATRLFPNGA
jgi:glutathione S-transferase